jgi:hypothetical protein
MSCISSRTQFYKLVGLGCMCPSTKMEAFTICYRKRNSFFYVDGIRMPDYSIPFQRNHYHFALSPLRLTICYRIKNSCFLIRWD